MCKKHKKPKPNHPWRNGYNPRKTDKSMWEWVEIHILPNMRKKK